jgi:hypothetical protein
MINDDVYVSKLTRDDVQPLCLNDGRGHGYVVLILG